MKIRNSIKDHQIEGIAFMVKTLLYNLDKALRTKSTPIEATQMFTNIKPINFLCEQGALKMYERIRRIPNSLWKNIHEAESRLPSKVSFLRRIKSIYQEHELEFPAKVRCFTSKKKKN